MEEDLFGDEVSQPFSGPTSPQPQQEEQQQPVENLMTEEPAATSPDAGFDFIDMPAGEEQQQPAPASVSTPPSMASVMTPLSTRSESTRVPQQGFYENLSHSGFLQKWRAEEDQRLNELAQKEAAAKAAVAEKAQADLTAFYEEQSILKQKQKERNRKLQADFISVRDSKSAKGWEGVVSLIDLSQKAPAGVVKDMSRMRGLLLELKNTPSA